MGYSESYGGGGGFDGYGDWDDSGLLDAYRAATEAAVSAYQNQLPVLNQQYDQAAQNAYAEYMKSKLGLPEQTAGMSTGMADTLLTQNDLNYQNNLLATEMERAAALADIQSQMAQTSAQGALQEAQVASDLEQRAYERWLAEQQMIAEQERYERELAAELQLAAAKSAGGSSGSSGGAGNNSASSASATKANTYPVASETFGAAMTPSGAYYGNVTAADYISSAGTGRSLADIESDARELRSRGLLLQSEYNKIKQYYGF